MKPIDAIFTFCELPNDSKQEKGKRKKINAIRKPKSKTQRNDQKIEMPKTNFYRKRLKTGFRKKITE